MDLTSFILTKIPHFTDKAKTNNVLPPPVVRGPQTLGFQDLLGGSLAKGTMQLRKTRFQPPREIRDPPKAIAAKPMTNVYQPETIRSVLKKMNSSRRKNV